MKVDAMVLAFISGSLIPLATGLLTKLSASSKLKAALSILLAGVVAVVAYLTDLGGVGTWKEAVIVFMTAAVTQAGMWQGFWKPTGVGPAVADVTGEHGLG